MNFAKIYEFPNEFRGEPITHSDVIQMTTEIFKARHGDNNTLQLEVTKVLGGWIILAEWNEG